jgi:hypothetical protein
VTKIVPISDDVHLPHGNDTLIEDIEVLLAQAKSGEIINVIYSAECMDGAFRTCASGDSGSAHGRYGAAMNIAEQFRRSRFD